MSGRGEEDRGVERVMGQTQKYAKMPEGKGGLPRENKTKFTWLV